jgi:hypothetical protein
MPCTKNTRNSTAINGEKAHEEYMIAFRLTSYPIVPLDQSSLLLIPRFKQIDTLTLNQTGSSTCVKEFQLFFVLSGRF